MKKSQWFALLLFPTLLYGASAQAPLNDPGDVATIKKMGREMGDAMVAGDIGKLSQIYADDFATIGSSGKIITKQNLLSDFESFHDKLMSYELGPIDVQVVGNLAVAHGWVTEKRIRDGKDVSGQGVYMDFLEKRAGKWVVVRSGGKIAKSEPR
jgi:ketosteroid isomerase-like protein